MLSVRFLIAIIAFFGYCIQYMQKVSMSIGILAMVNHTALRVINHEVRSKRSAVGNWIFSDSALLTLNDTFGKSNESALNRRGVDGGFSPRPYDADQCPELHAQAISFVSHWDAS